MAGGFTSTAPWLGLSSRPPGGGAFLSPAFWMGFSTVTGAGPTTPAYTVLEDAIKGVVGLPDVMSCLASHYGKTTGEHIQDAERRWLISQGATPAQLQDMWNQVFGPGEITRIKLAYWNSIRP